MRKLILIPLFFISLIIFGQSTKKKSSLRTNPETVNHCGYIKDNVLYVVITDGAGIKVPVTFDIDKESVGKIKKLRIYDEYIKDGKSDFICFSDLEVEKASMQAMFKMKNTTSYSIVKEAVGSITVTEFGSLMITFTGKAQNGYGNYLMFKVKNRSYWDDFQKIEGSECNVDF